MYQEPPVKLDYIFDLVCPWCYVGKWRLQRALCLRPQMQISLNWRPFLLNPDLPLHGMDRQLYLERKFGGGSRVERMHAAIRTAAEAEGLELDLEAIRWMPNTLYAHRLVYYASQFGLESKLVESLFHGFFCLGRNIGKISELHLIAAENGLDAPQAMDYVLSDRDRDQVFNENARSHRLGVNGVPCIVLNNQYALAGAQDPVVMLRLLDVVREKTIENNYA